MLCFDGTIYELTKCKLFVFITIICIGLLILLINLISYDTLVEDAIYDTIFTCCIIINSLLITYQFCLNLYKDVLSMRQSYIMHHISITPIQKRSLKLIAKLSILSVIQSFSILIFVICRIFVIIFDETNNNNYGLFVQSIDDSFIPTIIHIVGIFSVWLSFNFAEKYYWKICFKCQKCCLNKLEQYTKQEIELSNKINSSSSVVNSITANEYHLMDKSIDDSTNFN